MADNVLVDVHLGTMLPLFCPLIAEDVWREFSPQGGGDELVKTGLWWLTTSGTFSVGVKRSDAFWALLTQQDLPPQRGCDPARGYVFRRVVP